MLKSNLGIIAMAFIVVGTLTMLQAYTPPIYNSINFSLCSAYTPPTYNQINFSLGTSDACASANTCTYTSGNWNVLFSDYCNITSTVAAGAGVNNLTITGAGKFTVTANISGFKNYWFWGTAGQSNIYCYNGGCFK
jgi:hypothetical protein